MNFKISNRITVCFHNINCFYSILGEGSFSTVYLGESRAHQGGMVAIKVVEKHSLLKTKSIPNPNTDDIIYEEDEDSINSISVMEEKLEKHDQEIMRLVDKEIRIMSALGMVSYKMLKITIFVISIKNFSQDLMFSR